MSETRNRDRLLLVVSICLLWITLVIIGVSLTLGPTAFRPSWSWLLWSLLIAGIELLPVPAWRGLTISVGFPVLVMVAILYPPGAAGAIALIGAFDPREFPLGDSWPSSGSIRSSGRCPLCGPCFPSASNLRAADVLPFAGARGSSCRAD